MRHNIKGKKATGNTGSTINKTANRIISIMQEYGRNTNFEEAYKTVMTPRFVTTYNGGEFRRFASKGPSSLKELLRRAVEKKLCKKVIA